ncbi:helix-turn-helix domain-containing protein [Brucepastera parasyntrophica]|uniref:GNAT family N-acetyltransferase n=1 Tax=Brucepastera parasyntrophica TaxID=2880008 RepID=UPI00210A1401|nr:GNAT family N-acetyltransferase [Brucepastera parasyntrophica]ULQ58540.1 helix-turn-helix domain-containing protein [Brucepastera parasyntrophica]
MNYLEKMKTAIEYIETRLTQKLDLDDIAGAVHYSKYHLHRLFSRTVGLTIHDYVKRRQLTEAAKLLVFSDRPILDIALLAGYEGQQSFSAVFKAMYKQSPNRFREREVFYPLQLRYEFAGEFPMTQTDRPLFPIRFAFEEDLPFWMELTRLVVDGFPCLDEAEHIRTVRQCMKQKEALIITDGQRALGTMLFSYDTGTIGFLGVHPLCRRQGIARAFLDKLTDELLPEKTAFSITTYRSGDQADPGHRKALISLGFGEAEPLVEFGYPTQRFILPNRRSLIHG